jgi:hypothetical protein
MRRSVREERGRRDVVDSRAERLIITIAKFHL